MRLLLFLVSLLATLLVTSSVASPVPKDKRTTEDKLIGSWQLAAIDGRPYPPPAQARITFAKDKTFTIIAISRKRPPTSQTGHYRIDGDGLTLNVEHSTEPDTDPQRIAHVVSVTDNTLKLKYRSGSSDQITEYQRVAAEK